MSAPALPAAVSEGEADAAAGTRRIDKTRRQCLELVDAVRCMDPARVHKTIRQVDTPAALVLLAAMVDDSQPVADLLAWVDEAQPFQDTPEEAARRAHRRFVQLRSRGVAVEKIPPEIREGESRYQHLRYKARKETTPA